MIDLPIVDTHVHLWDTGYLRYPWLDSLPALNRNFLLDDYYAAYEPLHIEKMVFLQCDPLPEQDGTEVEWVTSLARQEPRILGIVAGARLEQGEGIRPFLETLAQNSLVKGIRRLLHIEQDDRFCLQPGFIKGVQMLKDYDMSFDLCCTHVQLPHAIEFVRQCPGVPIVLDHIGNPNIKDGVFDSWQANITELAAMPNVWCKVSGVATTADHETWTKEDLRPYIHHTIASFGFDRVMYGGDRPVVTLASEYTRWVETLAWAVQDCTEDEQRKLFHDNAERFYRV